jgi:cytochrome c peroxidase
MKQQPCFNPNSVPVPVPPDPPVLPVPTDITPKRVQQVAYAIGNPSGGYKVPSLSGLYLTAPYLHNRGVAAGKEALKQDKEGYIEPLPVLKQR